MTPEVAELFQSQLGHGKERRSQNGFLKLW
jgi:hypothetical protein